MHFGDFKAATPQKGYQKVPDIAVMDSNANLFLVGEAKTPWVHNIEDQVHNQVYFRKYLGRQYEGHLNEYVNELT